MTLRESAFQDELAYSTQTWKEVFPFNIVIETFANYLFHFNVSFIIEGKLKLTYCSVCLVRRNWSWLEEIRGEKEWKKKRGRENERKSESISISLFGLI